jgi:putative tricarboxylic transport membrane protein
MLIVMNVPMIKIFTKVLAVPYWALVPAVAIITAIGVYAVHATTFDLYLMIAIGLFGYVLRKLDFPLSAILLGFILGGMMEQNLRRALSLSSGDIGILFASPITWVVWALVAVMAVLPFWRAWRARGQKAGAPSVA